MIRAIAQGREDWVESAERADPAEWLVLRAAWCAVEPQKGSYDDGVIDADRRALITARKRGVDVILVVHSGGLPDWQIAREGWLDADALAGFGCYVDKLAHSFGELVKHWVGVWEPLQEAAVYDSEHRRVARRLLDAQSTAWLHLRKAPGPGGSGTLVGVAERFDVPVRKRDQLAGRVLGQVAGLLGQREAQDAWSQPAAHSLVSVLASGRLAPPFGAMGELSGATAAMDFTVAIRPSVADLHRIWRTGRAVFVMGATGAADQAKDEGVRILGVGPIGSSTISKRPKS